MPSQAVGPERWFFARGLSRRGPFRFDQLVQYVLDETDPRAPLVWRKGFATWIRAEDVPEIERRIAPVLACAAAAAAEMASRPAANRERLAPALLDVKPGGTLQLYGGIAAVIVVGLVAWLLRPAAPPATVPRPIPTAGPSVVDEPAVLVPTPAPSVSPAASRPGPATLTEREADLPADDVRRLRGVAAWSGDVLEITLENRTAWRVTELHVRLSLFEGEAFVEDARSLVLLPPRDKVAPGVADLLDRVAPDRKKPGLNPLDTGRFEAPAGTPPTGFRWEIESARGYAPR